MERASILRRGGVAFICILVATALAVTALPATKAYGAHSVNVTSTGRIEYDGYSTNWFRVDGRVAWCSQPDKPTPDGDFSAYTVAGSNSVTARAMAVAMIVGNYFVSTDTSMDFGSFPPGTSTSVPASVRDYFLPAIDMYNTDDSYYVRFHVLLSYAMNQYAPGWCDPFDGVDNVSQWQAQAAAFWSRCMAIATLSAPLDRFDMEYLSSEGLNSHVGITEGGGTVQCVAYLDTLGDPWGYVELTKTSANPSISDANGCYTLEGAVYGLYSDAACTRLVTRMTTDLNGYVLSVGVNPGAYWVREITPPAGYALDEVAHPVTVRGGAIVKVAYEDVPQSDDPGEGSVVSKHDEELMSEGLRHNPLWHTHRDDDGA